MYRIVLDVRVQYLLHGDVLDVKKRIVIHVMLTSMMHYITVLAVNWFNKNKVDIGRIFWVK